jgi:hypothetical protein
MFFKFTNRNPFRDLLRNARRVATSELTDSDKIAAYRDLHRLISPRLLENERFLNSQPAFSKRSEHWNQRDITSIRPVQNERNPWLRFKREFEQAVANDTIALRAISVALAWFYNENNNDDWIND